MVYNVEQDKESTVLVHVTAIYSSIRLYFNTLIRVWRQTCCRDGNTVDVGGSDNHLVRIITPLFPSNSHVGYDPLILQTN